MVNSAVSRKQGQNDEVKYQQQDQVVSPFLIGNRPPKSRAFDSMREV